MPVYNKTFSRNVPQHTEASEQLVLFLKQAALRPLQQATPRSRVDAGRMITRLAPHIASTVTSSISETGVSRLSQLRSLPQLCSLIRSAVWRTYVQHERRTCTFRFTGPQDEVMESIEQFLDVYQLKRHVHAKVKPVEADEDHSEAVSMDLKVSFGRSPPPAGVPSFQEFFQGLGSVTVNPGPSRTPVHSSSSSLLQDLATRVAAVVCAA